LPAPDAEVAADSLPGRLRALPPDRRLTRRHTAAELSAEAGALAGNLQVSPGEAVGLRLPNGEPWVVALLALLEAGARPLLAAADAPEPEFGRLLAAAGGRRELVFDGTYRLAGEPSRDPGPAAGTEPGVLLATSGSTGAPKLVLRPERSLVAEGLRYRQAARLDGTDRLLLPLPLSHAYALGWLAAALVTGTEVRPVPQTGLSAVAAELAGGATIIALVPTLARLLALRQRRRRVKAPGLRLAMIGAGAVDESLERDFEAAFGLPTGRNYGSTETGALFAGLADLPPLCVGYPMPGVEFRITEAAGEPCPAGRQGQLEVRLPGLPQWRATGDLAVHDEHGRVSILGRRYGAVRRGGRWIAPLEVEAVLREHPLVRDAHVRARRGRFADEDVLVADVAADPALGEAELRRFAGQRLTAYKLPERIHLRASLPRDAMGKVAHRQPRYRLAGPAAQLAALHAYRRTELLLALADLGLLDDLAGGADPDELAGAHELPVDRVHWLLAVAAGLGLLTTEEAATEPAGQPSTGQPSTGQPVAGLTELIGLEARLSRTWLTRQAIADAVRVGRATRPFDLAEPDPGLVASYRRAMHGGHTAARTRLGLRLAGDRARGRVLEVSAGPGRYLEAALTAGTLGAGSHLLPLGRLAGSPAPAVAEAARAGRLTIGAEATGRFDACIVANGIHGPGRGDDLDWLLGRLHPGGVLLIDDIFLPDTGGDGTAIGLDWLTHGGTSWPRRADLLAGLAAAGGTVRRSLQLSPPECGLILVTEEQ
jgi:acyl-CoA synthetase (AMP-forming)/AMP-acid ligase II